MANPRPDCLNRWGNLNTRNAPASVSFEYLVFLTGTLRAVWGPQVRKVFLTPACGVIIKNEGYANLRIYL